MFSGSEQPGQPSTEEAGKQLQLSATLAWVDSNYEWSEGVCVPRCLIYQHYQDFCRTNAGFVAVGPATFGKIIRQIFPRLTTRRLGTRGQSRYHYYGIGIKEVSPLYKQTSAGKGLSRFSGTKIKMENSGQKRHCLNVKGGLLLPDFPKLDDILLDDILDRDKANTFLVMYRTHCQRILDTVIAANFEEVHKFIMHFWQGMPDHLSDILHSGVLTRVIAASDVLLYKVLNDVLVPSDIQELPESLHHDVKSFVRNLLLWLESSLEDRPAPLRRRKMEVASWFVSFVNRQLSFIKLAQTARSLLNGGDNARKMALDLGALDLQAITAQLSVLLTATEAVSCADRISTFYQSLLRLLTKLSPLEDFLEWIDDVLDNCLVKVDTDEQKEMRILSSCAERPSDTGRIPGFVLPWSYLVTLVVRDLTLRNSSSFGSVHVVALMFDEYVMLVVETRRIRAACRLLQKDVSGCLKSESSFDVSIIGLDLEARLRNPAPFERQVALVAEEKEDGRSYSGEPMEETWNVTNRPEEEDETTRDDCTDPMLAMADAICGWHTGAPDCWRSNQERAGPSVPDTGTWTASSSESPHSTASLSLQYPPWVLPTEGHDHYGADAQPPPTAVATPPEVASTRTGNTHFHLRPAWP